jgi:hypothetical protein
MISDLQATGVFQSVGLFDGHTTPECTTTGAIEHLEEVDRGKSLSIDVIFQAARKAHPAFAVRDTEALFSTLPSG